jgi:undecaprenyl-diphosphatase
MNFVSDLGDDYYLQAIVVLSMALLYFAGLKSEAVKTALLTIASATTGTMVKSLTNRPRPDSRLVTIQDTLGDKSFPSLHVLIFTVFFGYMLYLAIYRIRTPWLRISIATTSLLLLFSIGISRIYLGAHWTSDVIGGYLLGVILLTMAIKIGGRAAK